MPILMKPVFPFSTLRSCNAAGPCNAFAASMSSTLYMNELCNKRNRVLLRRHVYSLSLVIFRNHPIWRATRVYAKDFSDDKTDTQFSDRSEYGKFSDAEELELLNKPLPMPVTGGSETVVENVPTKPDKDEALEPFLKLFKSKVSMEEDSEEDAYQDETDSKKIVVEYYDPKRGDFVVGVVVSGNENKLDVNVGADLLGTMLTKEVLPLYDKELDYLLCDLDKNAEEFMANGKMGIIRNEDAVSGHAVSGRPVVDAGTVLFAEVLGRTLSGRPLLSTRRFFRRIAWHRVRQIEQLNEPLIVTITEWNTGGLLTRIEGLRAFLPKAELVNRVNSFTDLKDKVGCKMYVRISRINESDNDLILSEREAWEKLYLREGTLLEGTVSKIYPYGALVRIGETNRSGLLHKSNITRGKFKSVSDLLEVGEKIKVLVQRSLFPDKISLSIMELESAPGLFISDKEKVFEEAEEMAKKYRRKLQKVFTTRKAEPPPTGAQLFDKEENIYANWKWFVFQRGGEPNSQ